MERVMDHPVIARLERDGYLKEPRVVAFCSECGEPIYDGESAYCFPKWGWVCEHCADMAYTEAEA